jgi:hypothetical protein
MTSSIAEPIATCLPLAERAEVNRAEVGASAGGRLLRSGDQDDRHEADLTDDPVLP